MIRRLEVMAAVVLVGLTIASGQTPGNNRAPLSPTARLTAAKTAYLKNAGGSDVPFNVISDGVQGWGRYQIVHDPAQADIIIEVMSPASGNGVTISSSSSSGAQNGVPPQGLTTTKETSVSRITLIVYDGRSKAALWSATEQPKGGLKSKTRDDKVVESAQHLVTKFRERVEPESK